MTNDDEHLKNKPAEPERPGLIKRLKQLYADRPGTFAVGVVGVSVLTLIVGGVLSGDVDLSTILQPTGGLMP